MLANLYLHYAFDMWMSSYPNIVFERYADDSVVHVSSLDEAERLKQAIGTRFAAMSSRTSSGEDQDSAMQTMESACHLDVRDLRFSRLWFLSKGGCKPKQGTLY